MLEQWPDQWPANSVIAQRKYLWAHTFDVEFSTFLVQVVDLLLQLALLGIDFLHRLRNCLHLCLLLLINYTT